MVEIAQRRAPLVSMYINIVAEEYWISQIMA